MATLVHAVAAGASHIDHVHLLRSGATAKVLGHGVVAPSTIGTFLSADQLSAGCVPFLHADNPGELAEHALAHEPAVRTG